MEIKATVQLICLQFCTRLAMSCLKFCIPSLIVCKDWKGQNLYHSKLERLSSTHLRHLGAFLLPERGLDKRMLVLLHYDVL